MIYSFNSFFFCQLGDIPFFSLHTSIFKRTTTYEYWTNISNQFSYAIGAIILVFSSVAGVGRGLSSTE